MTLRCRSVTLARKCTNSLTYISLVQLEADGLLGYVPKMAFLAIATGK